MLTRNVDRLVEGQANRLIVKEVHIHPKLSMHGYKKWVLIHNTFEYVLYLSYFPANQNNLFGSAGNSFKRKAFK